MLRFLPLLQTFIGRGVAWYAVSAVAESSRGFGTLTTLADSGAGCEVPHLLIEALPMGPETLLLYICLQARKQTCTYALLAFKCDVVLYCYSPSAEVNVCAAPGLRPSPPARPPLCLTRRCSTLAWQSTNLLQPRVDVVSRQDYLQRYYLTPPPCLPPSASGAAQAGSQAGAREPAATAASPSPAQRLTEQASLPYSYHQLQQRCWQLPGWQHYRSAGLEVNAMGSGGLTLAAADAPDQLASAGAALLCLWARCLRWRAQQAMH
jgi:hypothetical protein